MAPSRTTFQSILPARRPWHREYRPVARATGAQSSAPIAEARASAAMANHQRYRRRRRRLNHPPRRRPFARWAVPPAATIGTRSTGARLLTRSTAPAAAVPSHSRPCASSAVPTDRLERVGRRRATRRHRLRRLCRRHQAQRRPHRQVRHPHRLRPPRLLPFAPTTPSSASRWEAARRRWPRARATAIRTIPRRGWWWVSSSRIAL